MPDRITVLECQAPYRALKIFPDPAARQPTRDYSAGLYFAAEDVQLEDFRGLAEVVGELLNCPSLFAIRGVRKADVPRDQLVTRTLHDNTEGLAPFEDVPHHWCALDIDTCTIAMPSPTDRANIQAALEEWRALLPEGLRGAAMAITLTGKAHVSPTLRFRAWLWLDRPRTSAELRPWAEEIGADAALLTGVQPHYTAAPEFSSGADPLGGGLRGPYLLAGGDAHVELGERVVESRKGKVAEKYRAPTTALLEALGPAESHDGIKHRLCLALGATLRKAGWARPPAEHVVREWLAQHPLAGRAVDVEAGVRTAGKAFGARDASKLAGYSALEELLGTEVADAIGEAAGSVATYVRPGPAKLDADAPPRMVLSMRTRETWIDLVPGEGVYSPGIVTDEALRVAIASVYGAAWPVFDDNGKPVPISLVKRDARLAEQIEVDFLRTDNRFDAGRGALIEGLSVADVVPAFSEKVDRWLSALAGAKFERLVQWIASCRQDHLGDVAACCVIVGPADTGKSLLFKAIAQLYGASPVKLSSAVERFNSTIKKCPIILDDEAECLKEGKVKSSLFRALIQDRVREAEPKGLEKILVKGCARYAVTANDLSDLRFADVRGADSLRAVADRLLVVRASEPARGALAALRVAGSYNVDLGVVTRHLRWVWETVEPDRSKRFLGSLGHEDLDALEAAASGAFVQGEEVMLALAEWLYSGKWPGAGDAESMAKVVGDRIHLVPGAVLQATACEGHRTDLKRIAATLEPLGLQKRGQAKFGGTKLRTWSIELAAAKIACGLA